MPKHSKKMQRIEVAWVARQRTFIKSLGLVETPSLVEYQRLLNITDGLHLRSDRLPVRAWVLQRTAPRRRIRARSLPQVAKLNF